MAKKKSITVSNADEQILLNEAISRLSAGGSDTKDITLLAEAVSEADLSGPQLSALADLSSAGGRRPSQSKYYKAIASGLARVQFDAQKDSLKTAIAKAFPYGVRKAKREQEGKVKGKKTVRDDAAKIINNTKRSVEELEGTPDAFLTAWLASQGVGGIDIDIFKSPLNPPVSFPWMQNESPSASLQSDAQQRLNSSMSRDVSGFSLGATDDDGQPIFQLADPKAAEKEQGREAQSIPVDDFSSIMQSLQSHAPKGAAELWNGFWEAMPQEAIAGYVKFPSSLPIDAWRTLAARFDLDVRKVTSSKVIADKIKESLDKKQDAISKSQGNQRGSLVTSLNQLMPSNVQDVMAQMDVGDDLSGRPISWEDLMRQLGVGEIPFDPMPMSNAALQRLGVDPGQDERGMLFDSLSSIPHREENPKKKKKRSLAKDVPHGPHRKGGGFISLLLDLFEDLDDVSDEELEALVEALSE